MYFRYRVRVEVEIEGGGGLVRKGEGIVLESEVKRFPNPILRGDLLFERDVFGETVRERIDDVKPDFDHSYSTLILRRRCNPVEYLEVGDLGNITSQLLDKAFGEYVQVFQGFIDEFDAGN